MTLKVVAAILAVLCATLGFLLISGWSPSGSIQAREITLVDDAGRPVIYLSSRNNRPEFGMYTPSEANTPGDPAYRFLITDTSKDGPALLMQDHEGHRAALYMDKAKSTLVVDHVETRDKQ